MKIKRKSILFIDFCPISGSTQGLLTEVEYLLRFYKDEFNFAVVGYPDSIIKAHSKKFEYPYYESEATEIKYFWGSPLRTIKLYFLTLFKLAYVCLLYRPNIIHCNHYMWSIYANPIGFLLRIPVVIHLKDVWMLEPKISRILMKFYNNVRYIAVSKYVKKLFIEKYHLPPDKVVLIYDGINSDIFYPLGNQLVLKKYEQKNKRIIMMSRITPERDIEVFIDIAALILSKYPQISFRHYGYSKKYSDNSYFQELKKRVRSLKIDRNFKFINYTEDPRAVAGVLRNSFLSIVPARQFALPNTAIESFMSGTPCVGFATGGNSEIIQEENLVSANSSILYFEIINKYIRNKDRYLKDVRRGVSFAKRKFSSIVQCEGLIEEYFYMLKTYSSYW